MKITKKQLKQIIEEELTAADELGRWASRKSEDVIDNFRKGMPPGEGAYGPPGSDYGGHRDVRNVYARLLKLHRQVRRDGESEAVRRCSTAIGDNWVSHTFLEIEDELDDLIELIRGLLNKK